MLLQISGKYSDCTIDNELLKNLVIPPGLYVKKVHKTHHQSTYICNECQ